jgi:pimeloyl-ACP methyl ester carboxylesterase
MFGGAAPTREFPPIALPVLGLWSGGDAFCEEAWMKNSGNHLSGYWRYVRIEGASHWFAVERPDVVNPLLIEFLGGQPTSSS